MNSLSVSHAVHFVHDLEAVRTQLHHFGLKLYTNNERSLPGTQSALTEFSFPHIKFLSITEKTAASKSFLGKEALTFLPVKQILGHLVLETDDLNGLRKRLFEKGHELTLISTADEAEPLYAIPGSLHGLAYPLIQKKKTVTPPKIHHTLKEIHIRVDNPKYVLKYWAELFNLQVIHNSLFFDDIAVNFTKGSANRLHALVFDATSDVISQTEFRIGEGFYRFR
ncbi:MULTISPECIES: VOC family protein [unclassified Listeria]|uniref:VOC family protein n=1 Tax=unclassified Listeria TaxID=2642072 RepID=UPI000B5885C9|nr:MULTISPECIES: VOC family protein [unclassified Listeria]